MIGKDLKAAPLKIHLESPNDLWVCAATTWSRVAVCALQRIESQWKVNEKEVCARVQVKIKSKKFGLLKRVPRYYLLLARSLKRCPVVSFVRFGLICKSRYLPPVALLYLSYHTSPQTQRVKNQPHRTITPLVPSVSLNLWLRNCHNPTFTPSDTTIDKITFSIHYSTSALYRDLSQLEHFSLVYWFLSFLYSVEVFFLVSFRKTVATIFAFLFLLPLNHRARVYNCASLILYNSSLFCLYRHYSSLHSCCAELSSHILNSSLSFL